MVAYIPDTKDVGVLRSLNKSSKQDDIGVAFLKAIENLSKRQSVFEAFLGKGSGFRKYIKSVSLTGTQKINIENNKAQ